MARYINTEWHGWQGMHESAISHFTTGPAVETSTTTKALDSLCSIAMHLTEAPTVMLAQRNALTGTIQVRGRVGTLLNEVDMSFVLPDLDPVRQPFIVVPDIRHDRRFHDHPLLAAMPHIKSLIALVIPGCSIEHRAILKVINPSKAAINGERILPLLSELCVTAGDLLRLGREADSHARRSCDPATLSDDLNLLGSDGYGAPEEKAFYGGSDVTASFLLETLVKKRVLHTRHNADYMTLRTWRSALKKYQIAALTGVKAAPPPSFVAAVADEISTSIVRAHGKGHIRSVVPIPPGSSGRKTSLSILMAHAVADRLGTSVRHALAATEKAELGASSPHKSARLAPYRTTEPLIGPVLIVDDVASSGRHLELAIDACRASATAAYAIAWIGG